MRKTSSVAIVAGGAGGIGAATSRVLARRGVHVVIADLRADAATDTAQRLSSDGLTATAVTVDVADEKSVVSMVREVLDRCGRIDILISSAGIKSPKPLFELSLEEYQRVMRVNATGTWRCCHAVIPTMLRQFSGAIVNLSTVAARNPDAAADTTAHPTSEGAVISLTRALAREFAKSGIRVNAVSTDMTTSGVNGRPRQRLDAGAFEPSAVIVPIGSDVGIQKIAHVVALLALDNTLFVTGKVYDIDGDMER